MIHTLGRPAGTLRRMTPSLAFLAILYNDNHNKSLFFVSVIMDIFPTEDSRKSLP